MEYKYERFDPDDEMVQLIRQGQEAIASFVKEDPKKINEIQPNGFTLLQIAAYEGCEDIVKFLLDHGGDIHLKAYSDETALHLACDKGHEEIVKLLLKSRSQIKQKDDCWGNNALHFAARGGNEKIVKFILMQEIIDINIKNKFYRTALNIACFEGHKNVVKLLINQGASVDDRDLEAAIKGNDKIIVELVLDSGVDINKKTVFEQTLYLTCKYCKSNGEDIIKLLVERGPDVEIEEGFLLMLARMTAGDKNLFKLLTDFETDIYIPSDMRSTVRRLVSEGGNQEDIKTCIAKLSSKRLLTGSIKDEENESVVKLLLDQGVDVISTTVFSACLRRACNFDDEDLARKVFNRVPGASLKKKLDYCKNILLKVVECGNRNTLQLLLNQNIEVNDRYRFGETALHSACNKGHEDVVKMLIDRGADMKAIDEYGNTALHFAANGGNKGVFKLILDCGLDVNLKGIYGETVLHIACKVGHEEIFKILLQHDSFVNTEAKDWQKSSGRTALHFAVGGGNKNIVKLLLDRGIEVDAINDYKESALHVACEKGLEDIVQILIEYGANINIHNSIAYKSKTNIIFVNSKGRRCDNNGKSVLHCAITGQKRTIVKSLLDGGADVHSRDLDGTTPLLLAVQRGNLEIIELLLKYGAKTSDKDNQGYSVYHMVAKYLRPKNQRYVVISAFPREEEIFVSSVLKINKIFGMFSNLGLDINCVDNMGNTPMHKVNEDRCNLEMVKLLVNYGADIFVKNNNGETALKIACYHRLVSSAKLLLDLGADVEAEDNRGETVLASLTENDPFRFDYEMTVKLILNNGANIEVSNNMKNPPLFCTTILLSESLESFLDCGANVNETKDGLRPLSLVMENESYNAFTAVKLLLDYGADIDVKDEQLIRIIGIAVTKYKSGKFAIIHCSEVITRHIVKLKADNEDVPEKILEDIDRNDDLKDYKIRCEKEIDKMKSDDSELLLWRMLTSNHRCLANIARNEETVQFLASKECDLKYPIYSSVLKDQMRRGIWRKILLDKVKFFFKTMGETEGNKHLPRLPYLCVEKILSFLSNRDFRNLIKVCDPFNDFDLDLSDIKIPK